MLAHSLSLSKINKNKKKERIPDISFNKFLIFFKCSFTFEKERQSMNRGGAERERETESEAGSGL